VRVIRGNPGATVGATVLVAAVSALLPLAVTAVMTAAVGLAVPDGSESLTTGELVGLLAAYGSLLVGGLMQYVGQILVTGMVAHATAAAAVGRRLRLREAWDATRGARWRLVGLTLLILLVTVVALAGYAAVWVLVAVLLPVWAVVLFGVVTVPAFLVGLCWWWVRVVYLAVPPLMLERTGVTQAMRRSVRLTRRQFWRTFGIALLTVLVGGIAGGLLSAPFSVGAQVVPFLMGDSRYAVLALVALSSVGGIVQAAFVTPFSAAVASLQYVDQRMRKEGYDVELLAAAGVGAR
jgi:uncharacterized membrane protein YhdT